MNNVDKQYLALMQEVLEKGSLKHTRAGDTLSVFGKSMEFNLQEGFPLLTTKKVFYKGIIHELLWFLKGDTNIKYLVDNGIHIWDDDAYRWFKSLDFKSYKVNDPECIEGMYKLDRCVFELDELKSIYTLWEPASKLSATEYIPLREYDEKEFKELTKEEFLDFVQRGVQIRRTFIFEDGKLLDTTRIIYTFGDLGPVYGKQWRSFGFSNVDQINNIINSLKSNPDDRRMLCTAFNPDVLDEVALPPCHVMFQFYTRELDDDERITIWYKKHNLNDEVFDFEKTGLTEHTKEYRLFGDYFYYKTLTKKELIDIINSEYDIPKRELSLSFSMRSNDFCVGNPYNVAEYGLLCHIIANICNMTVGKLIFFGGDIHIYTNHIEQAKEQLKREGSDKLPTLIVKRKLESIDDITIDDFEIKDYHSDPAIKYQLNVG